MEFRAANTTSRMNRNPLAASLVGALIAMGATLSAHAATHTVINCSDTGAGSLRSVIADAATHSGDTVNFSSSLGCSKITLTSGEIVVPQDTLTIQGPSLDAFYIDGNESGRVVRHSGSGTLTISSVTISHGFLKSSVIASGGCLVSNGSVVLIDSIVELCAADAQGNASAYGGAIFTGKDLALSNSRVAYSLAVAATAATGFTQALGGGAYVSGNFLSTYSSILDNSVGAPNAGGHGGGLHTNGNANIQYSTIAGNHADQAGGWEARASGTASVTIAESTLSDNTAIQDGGIFSVVPLTVVNSTIAFNQATSEWGGLYVGANLTLDNAIIADNRVPTPATPEKVSDLGGSPAVVVSGTTNLVTSSALTPPADTINACPKLGPLADNGGPTLTHALLHTSPAINHGHVIPVPITDQRGQGYPRLTGASVDIGAFEWQGAPDDRLFLSRFEKGCDN
jgi:hypothetical protein